MLNNYLIIALRNLFKNKGYSAISIGGLAAGMAVAMLIGLWVWDELSYNKTFDHYATIGKLYQNRTFNEKTNTYDIVPQPMAAELRNQFPDFEKVSLSSLAEEIIAFKEVILKSKGLYVEPDFLEIFSVQFIKSDNSDLKGVQEIMISSTLADKLFGTAEPIGHLIRYANKTELKVSAVFKDFASNSELAGVDMFMPWLFYQSFNKGAKSNIDNWGSNDYQCYVQIKDNTTFAEVQPKIKDVMYRKVNAKELPSKPDILLQPLSRRHLYDTFTDGVNTGGAVQMVWLFGLIGIFVLLLACINFMNLSTARSEKRAKEVGVRKAIGSYRYQLVYQFISESLLTTSFSFVLAFLIVLAVLGSFNQLANKQIEIPFGQPWFWVIAGCSILFTSLISGSYPAFYLSSFDPVRVLKGTFKAGRFSALPRKVLVVIQFTVSLVLIIGTMIVYRQIQFIKDRPIGYDSDGLIYLQKNTPELLTVNFDLLRNELLNSGVVVEVCESSNSITSGGFLHADVAWPGKPDASSVLFNIHYVSHEYGKTVGFQLEQGRDFSREFALDKNTVILNQAATDLIGIKDVVGKSITKSGTPLQVIGVIKDMIEESPFRSPLPAVYLLWNESRNFITLKINSTASASLALNRIKEVFKRFNPSAPFEYQFVDQEYARKFSDEERLGKLASGFALLAIFISFLGLYGLASFIAEQRFKEIGIRKVLGAGVTGVIQLLSKEFLFLVMIACFFAIPLAWYFMKGWLEEYQYRTEISYWIYILACASVLFITLITVGYKAFRAAIQNPVTSLRME